MSRWHVNQLTGRVGKCNARRSCPFGDMEQDHYPTREEAQKVYERLMKDEVLTEPQVRDSMKEMDANDLAHDLIGKVRELGFDVEEFNDLLELSSILHAHQRRRNRLHHKTTPYIEHPLRVTLRLVKGGVTDQDIIKAALLHDTVEDGSKIFADIYKGEEVKEETVARDQLLAYIAKAHGKETARIVKSVTNDYVSAEDKKSRTIVQKNSEYKRHLEVEITDNPKALLLKLSDFLDNAGSLHHTDVPGGERTTLKLSVKYAPCIDLFKRELSKGNEYIPEETNLQWQDQLERVRSRLEKIDRKYSHLREKVGLPPKTS